MQSFRPSRAHESLGEGFFDAVEPARFPQTVLRFANTQWAKRIGLADLSEESWIAHFGRFEPLPGSLPHPLALRYHGHQFRVYNADLGDGRGFLFAQMHDSAGRLLDFGTKGSGRTPFSRTADGRLTLKGGIREVLATAMLEAQGVYTSKSFSLIETGEELERNDEPSPTRSSVLVRLSHSHIRIGTFQRLLAHDEPEKIERLIRHCLTHYPDEQAPAVPASNEDAALMFFKSVTARIARLGAQWMAAGFVHGVLNTDNINITGESFDYGPYRWLPIFEPGFTAAYFDEFGLYAFGRQPNALKWNLARLAECLTPFLPVSVLEEEIGMFDGAFNRAMGIAVAWRLGLAPDQDDDEELVPALFTFLRESRAPFEAVFQAIAGGRTDRLKGLLTEAALHPSLDALSGALKGCKLRDGFDPDHSFFRGAPETLLYDEIEALWTPIAKHNDWSAFEAKLASIERMRLAYGG
jgi:serine/tyrosine/threonine adenylyltransferase